MKCIIIILIRFLNFIGWWHSKPRVHKSLTIMYSKSCLLFKQNCVTNNHKLSRTDRRCERESKPRIANNFSTFSLVGVELSDFFGLSRWKRAVSSSFLSSSWVFFSSSSCSIPRSPPHTHTVGGTKVWLNTWKHVWLSLLIFDEFWWGLCRLLLLQLLYDVFRKLIGEVTKAI